KASERSELPILRSFPTPNWRGGYFKATGHCRIMYVVKYPRKVKIFVTLVISATNRDDRKGPRDRKKPRHRLGPRRRRSPRRRCDFSSTHRTDLSDPLPPR